MTGFNLVLTERDVIIEHPKTGEVMESFPYLMKDEKAFISLGFVYEMLMWLAEGEQLKEFRKEAGTPKI